MKKQDLDNWYKYIKQINNGYYMSINDYRELINLNHLVMEQAHKIHNNNNMINNK